MQATKGGFKEIVVNKVPTTKSAPHESKSGALIRRFNSDLYCCVYDVSLSLQDGFVAIRRIRARMRLKSNATPARVSVHCSNGKLRSASATYTNKKKN